MADDIAQIQATVYAWFMGEYFLLASNIAFVYYCLLTLDKEVKHVWLENWKTGKVLFLTVKWLGVINFLFEIVSALWLCLYALLGAKLIYFAFLVIAFLILSVPSDILRFLNGTRNIRYIPLPPWEVELGYVCTFAGLGKGAYLRAGHMVSLARTIFASILGIVTFIVHYRKQKGSLIKVIRRDGGVYYLSTIALRLADVVVIMKATDTYQVNEAAKRLLIPVFALQLLLNMKNVGDPGTKKIVSTLIFAGTNSDDSEEELEPSELVETKSL
ncbi:hypothetical protein EST38_g7730 [Candolleomyces aberdarensis]|uniref:DUF6533 domain-containing protein n=1 Tax=Candolleomyces aberdarensis TaxID=2316362 RepID=A0A4Q2DG70_9AGAR|nr:hypothetical protein EST38_g7730 [Candolleomyces aberdarensis]